MFDEQFMHNIRVLIHPQQSNSEEFKQASTYLRNFVQKHALYYRDFFALLERSDCSEEVKFWVISQALPDLCKRNLDSFDQVNKVAFC